MQRLGKNINGYFGETINIGAVVRDCSAAARAYGWAIEEIHPAPNLVLGLTRPSSRITDRPSSASAQRRVDASPVLRSSTVECGGVTNHPPRIYISTGIHGDEPAGPLAVRQLLRENAWPRDVDLWLCPCLNPTGFALNRRENQQGLDLNRQYLGPVAGETLAHIAWLKRQPSFDLCLCLHEDWESDGFYLYEQNPDHQPSLAEAMIARIGEVCPIDRSEVIEGRSAHNGIIRPSIDPRSRPQWPEAFFLITHKTRLSYTLEAPSDFPLAVRVAALTEGVNTALETTRQPCGPATKLTKFDSGRPGFFVPSRSVPGRSAS